MRNRRIGWMAGGLLALAIAACQSNPGSESVGVNEATVQAEAVRVPGGIAPPPGIDPHYVLPLQGEALKRAQLSIDEVLASLPEVDYLPPLDQIPQATGESRPQPEPPLAAQRAYVAGRAAWRDGKYEAVQHFEQAARLAPNAPEIVRLLGQIYTATGNKVRGAVYLKKAVALDPTHVPTIFTLGRFALEQGNSQEAIVVFHHCLALLQRGYMADQPAVAALAQYYYAGALAGAGHAAAAIDAHQAYLQAMAAIDSRYGSMARELAFLQAKQGLAWQSVGDLYNVLNKPADALAVYQRAQEMGVDDESALTARLVYTLLRLKRDEAAQELAIDRVQQTDASEQSLQLVVYLTQQLGSDGQLADRLQQVYFDQGRPITLALAVARLMPRDQAETFLRAHLTAKPGDTAVFDQLIGRWLLASDQPGQDGLIEAVRVTAQVMEASPRGADYYARTMLRAAGEMPAVVAAIDAMPAEEAQQPVVLVLRGLAVAAQNQIDVAEQDFRAALNQNPNLTVARLQLVKIAIVRQRYDEAAALLEPLKTSTDPTVVSLHVRVLAELGKVEEALALIDQMIEPGQADTALILQKAELQLQTGDATGAERTLLDALNARPEDEAIYATLFNLYDPGNGQPSPIKDWQRQWSRLVRRLLSTIPNSRLGRLVRAELLDAKGEFAEAETLLKSLLAENDHDLEALSQLLEVYIRANRKDEATTLVEQKVAAFPDDREVLQVAQRYFEQINDVPRMLAVVERLLKLEPSTPERARSLAVLYLNTDRADEAVRVLNEALASPELENPEPLAALLGWALQQQGQGRTAITRLRELMDQYPNHTAGLRYELAQLYDRQGDRAAFERLLKQNIEQFPDHTASANGLAYTWTVENRNLDEARGLLQRAVDADPDNAAYLDSLGWVYYKLGQFEEAVVWLRRSRAAEGGAYPVILDHLGDALYRQGQQQEAVRAWQEAQQLLSGVSGGQDPELVGLDDRLAAKLQAVSGDEKPAVAPLPGESSEPAAAVDPVAAEAAVGDSDGPGVNAE